MPSHFAWQESVFMALKTKMSGKTGECAQREDTCTPEKDSLFCTKKSKNFCEIVIDKTYRGWYYYRACIGKLCVALR